LAIVARSSSISASRLSIRGQYQNRQTNALSIHGREEHRRLFFRKSLSRGGAKTLTARMATLKMALLGPGATTFRNVPGAHETREPLHSQPPHGSSPNNP
jgi:hypothetical protein